MVDGRYFDGRTAAAHVVTLTIAHHRVIVEGNTVQRNEPIGAVAFSERIGRTPRFVRFHDGAFCEVTDVDALHRMLAASGIEQDRLSIWEQNKGLAVILAVALVLLAIGTYRYGLPLLAKSAANRLPVSAVSGLSTQVLSTLDATVFAASEIPPDRRAALENRLHALQLPSSIAIPLQLQFRKSDALGANALALPSGVVIVTDGLVHLARSDDEILAVVAHEAGHVQERHGLRNIIQSSVMSILVTWYIGDVSGLVAAAPVALLEAKYSRDLEREADAHAARTLAANGLSLGVLADILERMDAAHSNEARRGSAVDYLSSHPTTTERLERLRNGTVLSE